MRVLQLIDSLRYGGAQKLMITFAEQASLQKVEVEFACLNNQDAMPLAPHLERWGFKVASFPAASLFSVSRIIKLARYIRVGKFTVIHSHLTYSNILAGILRLLTGVPVVSTLHSVAQDKRHANFLRDNMEMWALRSASRVIAVGSSVDQVYGPILRRKLDVLPNAVGENVNLTEEERLKFRTELAGDPSKILLVSVGRLSPDKCVDDLLIAFSRVHTQTPNTVLLVAGDGVLLENLKAQTSSLGLEKCVFWLGMRDDIPHLLAASDVYVSASKREGLPVAILEAMMAGLPIVVTGVGEIPLLLREDAGVLVAPQKPDELADAISKTLNDGAFQKKIAGLARARALSEYSADIWFKRLVVVYNGVRGDR